MRAALEMQRTVGELNEVREKRRTPISRIGIGIGIGIDSGDVLNGFIGNAEVRISPFTPPTGTAPVMDLPAGDVALVDLPNGLPSTSGTFAIDGKKITSSGNLRALTINRKNGLVSGTMRVGNETLGFKTLSFKGAIDQVGRFGFGQVGAKGVTGAMELFNPIP